jgi:hypothetical protein
MMVKILTGPAIVGHLFRDRAEAIALAIPVLVGTYAERAGLDVHRAEAQLVECRLSRVSSRSWTEVRVAGVTIASWREVES